MALLSLGVKLNDLLHTHPSAASVHHENQAQQPTPITVSPLVRQPWFRALLQADACAANREFSEASRLYQQIDAQYLPQSTYVLCQLGYVQYLNGDYSQALHSLQRAQQIDPLLLKHMDMLAFLIYTESKDNSLEKTGQSFDVARRSSPGNVDCHGLLLAEENEQTHSIRLLGTEGLRLGQ